MLLNKREIGIAVLDVPETPLFEQKENAVLYLINLNSMGLLKRL